MMQKGQSKIIIVLGQTATGKSDLAVRIARRFGGEVISADSRQVYRGLNIGTGKIMKKEMRGIPHFGIDIASPQKQYSVHEYIQYARKKIEEIHARGKIPIICGGTGFYIDALLGTVRISDVPPNPKLRKRLEKLPTGKLFEKLKKLDPCRAKTIDPHNRRRLVRAIEVTSSKTHPGYLDNNPCYQGYDNVLKIGLTLPDTKLKEKITIRLFARISRGMVAEAKRLHKKGLSWKRMEELGLEYRYLALLLQKKIGKNEFAQKLETAIWHYARRQKTWFKRDRTVEWFLPKEYKKIQVKIRKFLS